MKVENGRFLWGVEAPPPTIEYEKRNILTVGADIIRPIYFNLSALPTPFLFSLLYSFRIRETVGE